MTLILFWVVVFTGLCYAIDKSMARRWSTPEKLPLWGSMARWCGDLFMVMLFIFVLRSFFFEPFRIPSDSMVPTLVDGDFILVNKYTYGVRLPLLNSKVISFNDPQRGDVMVFRYPEDPSVDFIKRVVGVPGDVVRYENKKLTINGQAVMEKPIADYFHKNRNYYSKQFASELNGKAFNFLNDASAPAMYFEPTDFPFRENCHYYANGMECIVPPGNYFMLGDNRDNSRDSRVWGFVPEENIIGKAFLVWMNFSDFSRMGSF